MENRDMFAGLVLLAPSFIVRPRWLTTSLTVNFLLKKFSQTFPNFQLPGINPRLLSRDPQIVQSYTEDPLVWHGGSKARWLASDIDIIPAMFSRFNEFTCPFFVLQGSEDKLCDPAGAQMFYENAASANKQLKMYPGAYHQIHNEPNGQGEEAVSDIVKWITDMMSS